MDWGSKEWLITFILPSMEVERFSCENASLTIPESKFTELIWKLPPIYKLKSFFWYILMTYIRTQAQRKRKKNQLPTLRVHFFCSGYINQSFIQEKKELTPSLPTQDEYQGA